MSAQWLEKSSAFVERVPAVLEGAWHAAAQPQRAQAIRKGVLILLGLWAVLALAQLLTALVPAAQPTQLAKGNVLNPVSASSSVDAAQSVDIDVLVRSHLFGEVGKAGAEPVAVNTQASSSSGARDGIEDGARETRLNLRLVGVVASTEDGLGHAIIEHNKQQAVYAVEDKLPLSGQVTLAKVLPTQVVLDNSGTYELLKLFDDSELSAQVTVAASQPAPRAREPVAVDKREDANARQLARSYRDRLYQNPQSLAEVVRVSPVREGSALVGYRIGPGKDADQFNQLGFEQGDVVKGVNGIALDNPANTMRLYQTMRTASEAVFDIERGGQLLSISVSLGNP